MDPVKLERRHPGRIDDLSMQVNEKDHVRVDWCPAKQRYQATHLLLGVSVWLPVRQEPYTVGFDAEGSAFFRVGNDTVWASDVSVFGATVVSDEQNNLILLPADGDPTHLQQHRNKYDEDELELSIEGGACEIRVWIFETAWLGARVYWCPASLWGAAKVDSPMSATDWMGSFWPRWGKRLNKLNIQSPPHLMNAGETHTSAKKGNDEPFGALTCRVLKRRAWSTFAMLPVLCNLAAPTARKKTEASKANTRPWASVLLGLLAMAFSCPGVLSVFADAKAMP